MKALESLDKRLSELEAGTAKVRLIWYDDPDYGREGRVKLKWLDELPKKI